MTPTPTLSLVPLWVVDALLGDKWWEYEHWAPLTKATRWVGGRLEINVSADGVADYVREAATGYLEADRAFAGDLEAGGGLGPWVATRRRLGLWRQGAGTKSNRRSDLSKQFEALSRSPELSEVTRVLLGSSPDVPELRRLSESVSITGTVTKVGVRVEGTRQWEAVLGGAAWPQEVEREFVIEANHAAWRDRQVRRLSSLEVLSVEMHADPSPWRELITDGVNDHTGQRRLAGVKFST